ncbi:scarecrow-like protein 21 [Malania oleifera]|uniref:scarecrow-like protein 21 n=1 Tax=Malania oleifera TaxID=397392 RepID=UPI0025ADDEB8|nr:scarecrow-like protein 21 [Malania oleifera]XP_057963237.1 scarecrow-like protein 21 [Malania oleifera]
MDSHLLSGFGATGGSLSHTSSHPTVSSTPTWLLGSLKFDFGNSPTSSFSTHFDSDTPTTLSDSQDQHSSTESPSGVSASCSFSVGNSPGNCAQESLQLYSAGLSFSRNANCGQKITYTLQELETTLMEPDADEEEFITPNLLFGEDEWPQGPDQRYITWNLKPHGAQACEPQPSYASGHRKAWEGFHIEKRHMAMEEMSLQGIPPGSLKQLLIECARALSENKTDVFDKLVESARGAVSISGEPIQRLGAYMIEGLIARKVASGSNIYQTLICREPEGNDLLSYMHILYEICPYLKFGYMAANGAIAEACRTEDRIHIIDFQIAQGTQWMILLQALAARPSGAPLVRITGIDDPVSKYARGSCIEAVGKRLATISEKFKIPVEFHAMPVSCPNVTRDMLDVRPGEALAVNFPLQLHHTPDESVDVKNPRDELLRMVKSLSPKVVTLVEQESNTNTAPFFTRFLETLEFYSAMFESIDATLPRESKDRINVEQHCLARDIVNIIACEGKERVERHELFGKWKSRLTMAGFQQYPVCSYVNSVIKRLLKCYSEHYTLVEKEGATLLGWKNRNLISASAWH